jgi:hypothetical protein
MYIAACSVCFSIQYIGIRVVLVVGVFKQPVLIRPTYIIVGIPITDYGCIPSIHLSALRLKNINGSKWYLTYIVLLHNNIIMYFQIGIAS